MIAPCRPARAAFQGAQVLVARPEQHGTRTSVPPCHRHIIAVSAPPCQGFWVGESGRFAALDDPLLQPPKRISQDIIKCLNFMQK
jgi:hypothetical protein